MTKEDYSKAYRSQGSATGERKWKEITLTDPSYPVDYM